MYFSHPASPFSHIEKTSTGIPRGIGYCKLRKWICWDSQACYVSTRGTKPLELTETKQRAFFAVLKEVPGPSRHLLSPSTCGCGWSWRHSQRGPHEDSGTLEKTGGLFVQESWSSCSWMTSMYKRYSCHYPAGKSSWQINFRARTVPGNPKFYWGPLGEPKRCLMPGVEWGDVIQSPASGSTLHVSPRLRDDEQIEPLHDCLEVTDYDKLNTVYQAWSDLCLIGDTRWEQFP